MEAPFKGNIPGLLDAPSIDSVPGPIQRRDPDGCSATQRCAFMRSNRPRDAVRAPQATRASATISLFEPRAIFWTGGADQFHRLNEGAQ